MRTGLEGTKAHEVTLLFIARAAMMVSMVAEMMA
jgi:hypothetical protein